MITTIKLLAALRKLARTKALAVPLEQNGNVGTLLQMIGENNADIVTEIVNETHVLLLALLTQRRDVIHFALLVMRGIIQIIFLKV